MKHQPARTCIGCRGVFTKDEVIRIVAGPGGIAIDYREKLPGRAAYLCPKKDCINKAFLKDNLAKALRLKVRLPGVEEFITLLTAVIKGKIKSLIAMAAKAGKLASGYSAVLDALEKGRVEMLLYAQDISEGTKEKIAIPVAASLRTVTLFTRDELGMLMSRELVGVIGIEDKGFADAVWREAERLKGLINNHE
jgi:predicted RNA-binding protein YlxR (DUF448 family)/ribosomal protein L30E